MPCTATEISSGPKRCHRCNSGEKWWLDTRELNADAKLRDIPVILMSGYTEQEVTTRFAGQGLAGFLQKPFQFRKLCDTVSEVLSTS